VITYVALCLAKKRLREEMDDNDDDSLLSSKRQNTGSSPVETGDTNDVRYQAGSYALEVLSSTRGTRIHSLGMTVIDDRITLWYYDASGIVRSEPSLSLVNDFEEVAAIFVGLASCDVDKWGALPSVFQVPEGASYPESFPPLDLQGYSLVPRTKYSGAQVKLTLSKLVFSQYAIVGRRTFVYEAVTDSKLFHGKDVIVKFSQQVCTRKSEAFLLDVARKADVDHLPELHLSEDLWRLSDGIREAFYPDMKDAYEDRVLRMLVYTKYQPLEVLFSKSAEHLPTMVDQMLDCKQICFVVMDVGADGLCRRSP
jgi:hypothetical protein